MPSEPLSRHFRHAVRDLRANRLLHAITLTIIALSILVVGIFGLFAANTDQLVRGWTSEIRILAYAEPGTPSTGLARIEGELARLLPDATIERVSREEGLARLKKRYPTQDALFSNLAENPLPELFIVTLPSSPETGDGLDALSDTISAISGVEFTTYGKKWIRRLLQVIRIFRLVICAMGILFLLITTFIIANTIRLSLYTRRDEIEIMRLVGAEEAHIRAPFTMQGLLIGFLGGSAGLLLLLAAHTAFLRQVGPLLAAAGIEFHFIPTSWMVAIVMGTTFVGWTGCQLSFRQHL